MKSRMLRNPKKRRRSLKVSARWLTVAEKAKDSKEQIAEKIKKHGYAEVPPEDL